MKDIRISFQDDEAKIKAKDEKIKLELEESLNLLSETQYHRDLQGFDFESSGHTGFANFDGSAPASIAATLANVGTAGTYSVVTTDAKGRVTQGGQIVEVGTSGQSSPSASLAVGGLFFKEI